MQNKPQNVIPITLLVGRQKAVELLNRQIERGEEIRSRRIRSREDLDSARSEKNGWVSSSKEMFKLLFSDPAPAEQYTVWSPAILPEYAGLELFVEQFYEEMDQRLQRLGAIHATVESMPDPETAAAPAPLLVQPGQAAAVKKKPPAAPAAAASSASPAPAAAKAAAGQRPADVMATERILLVCRDQPDAATSVADFLDQLGMNIAKPEGPLLKQEKDDTAFVVLLLTAEQISAVFDQSEAPLSIEHRTLLMELGFCAGRFGAERTFLLGSGGMPPLPPDAGLNGCILDAGGGWQLQLARQMRRSGLEVDLNKIC